MSKQRVLPILGNLKQSIFYLRSYVYLSDSDKEKFLSLHQSANDLFSCALGYMIDSRNDSKSILALLNTSKDDIDKVIKSWEKLTILNAKPAEVGLSHAKTAFTGIENLIEEFS